MFFVSFPLPFQRFYFVILQKGDRKNTGEEKCHYKIQVQKKKSSVDYFLVFHGSSDLHAYEHPIPNLTNQLISSK
jgi:ribosomal silencing factor RsfS